MNIFESGQDKIDAKEAELLGAEASKYPDSYLTLFGCPTETCWYIPDYSKARAECKKIRDDKVTKFVTEINDSDSTIKRTITASSYQAILKSKPGNKSEFNCRVTIEYDQTTLVRDKSCDCQTEAYHPDCPVKRHSSCLVNADYDVFYSGLDASEDAMNFISEQHKEEGFRALLCTSGEHLPTGMQNQVRAKFDFLMNQLADISQPGNSKAEIIKNIKLLIEYHGHMLDDERKSEFMSRQVDWLDMVPGCGVQPSLSYGLDPCFSGDDLKQKIAPVSVCERFTSEHVAALSLYWAAGDCFEQLTASVPQTCRDDYQSSITNLANSLLDNQFSKVTKKADTGKLDYLEEALSTLDKWYIKMEELLSDEGVLHSSLTEQLNVFWKRIYNATYGFDVDSLTDPGNIELLDSLAAEAEPFLADGLFADRQVLLAAFSEHEPMTRAPLLMITADALRGMYEKLTDAALIRDFACRFLYCDIQANPSELLELWQLLGSLHDKALLDQVALFDASKQTHIRSEYQAVFQAIYDRHALLQTSLQDAEDRAIGVEDLLEEDVGVYVKPLKSILISANQRWNNAFETGSLDGIGLKDLHAGVRVDTREYIANELGARIQGLSSAINSYQTQRRVTIEDLIGAMRGEDAQVNLKNRFRIALEQYNQLTGELDGLRKLEAWDETRFGHLSGSFEKQINDLIQSGVGDVNQQISLTLFEGGNALNLDAFDARYDHAAMQSGASITDVAVLHQGSIWKLDVKAGDRLSFRVDGNWSPSCAVSTTSLIGHEGNSYTPVVTDPVTGPEGYSYYWQGSEYRTVSSSDSFEKYSSSTTTISLCVNSSIMPTFFGIGGGFTSSACHITDFGSRTSHSDNFTTRNEAGISTSFNAGLRVAETPFTFAPVGSLLMVAVERPSPGVEIIRDVRVVNRAAGFVFDDQREVYLVVNDRIDGPCSVSAQNSLMVQVAHTRSLGGMATQLADAMTLVAGELRGHLLEMLSFNSGVMPSLTLSFLKSWAHDQLSPAIRQDVGAFPSILTNIFDTWVEREIAGIERKIQMIELKHRMDILTLELEAINDDVAGAAQRSRLQRLQALLGLRNLSGKHIRQDLRTLTRLINKYVYPVLDLRYRNALSDFLSDPGTNTWAELEELREIDFSQPLELAAERTRVLTGYLKDSIDAADFGMRSDPVYIALSFPNPNFQGFPDGGDIKISSLADSVWTQIYGRQLASITVSPEDLYDSLGGEMSLFCDESAPVVLASAVMAIRPGLSDPIGDFYRIPGKIGATQNFPTPEGPNYYSISDPAWVSWNVRIMGADWGEMLSFFMVDEVYRGFGNGLSPFATYHLNFNSLEESALNQIESLVMMFKVDVRSGLGHLTWLNVCNP